MRQPTATLEHRILVLMSGDRDTERTMNVLGESGLFSASCNSLDAMCSALGEGAGALLLTDEMLSRDAGEQLDAALRAQPAWSALPVLLLTREGVSQRSQYRSVLTYDHVTIVERPARVRSLVSAVQSALRARTNQYAIREAIAERDRQAAALIAQDEQLRFTLAAGSLGSWEYDSGTQRLDCSDICKSNYGLPPESPFSYADYLNSIGPVDRERVVAAIDNALRSGAPLEIEYQVVWPNGEAHWVMVRGRAEAGSPLVSKRLAGVSLDITERKRLHEELLRSQSELAEHAEQLKAADRRKDEFLATLAHELRNPLAPIRTGLSILNEPHDEEIGRRTIGVMQRQVNHMVMLIDDLLDVSRITLGKLQLKPERISLSSAVEAAIEANLPALQRAQHTFRAKLSEVPLYLDADPTRLAQVVSNLLNNACKYTPNGGTVELTVWREGQSATLSVSDNGMGIPQGRIQDLFQMFNQVDDALDRAQGGLGIGLALVRKLVLMHGGSVEASSPGPGLGSTFTIRLPLAEGAPEGVALPVQVEVDTCQRILVVDDNEDAAELLALMLGQAGFRATTAYDGPTAIEAANSFDPSIVILDIGLPGMSGYEVAAQLRAETRTREMRLIALTGWGTPEDRNKALAAGFDEHLTKPVAAEDLRRALNGGSAKS